jgi:hypothetical protein
MAIEDREEILSGDRLSRPDEQTEIDDEISDQLKEDAGSRHDVAIIFVNRARVTPSSPLECDVESDGSSDVAAVARGDRL